MASSTIDPFGALAELELSEGPTSYYRLPRLEEEGVATLDRLPFSIRILLEKKLIAIQGKKEVMGRPFLYATTSRFLEVFGLENLSSLPSMEEIKQLKDSDIPLLEQEPQ